MQFARREKLFVYIAAAVICFVVFIELLVVPIFDKKDKLKREIITKEKNIEELTELSRRYQSLDRVSWDIEKALSTRTKEFNLRSFLLKAAEQTKVKPEDIRTSDSKNDSGYKEIQVRIALKAITLEQLTNFLYQIEKPDQLVFVRRLEIADNKRQEGYLDSNLTVITFQ